MGEFFVIWIVCGIALVIFGCYIFKHPETMWNLSLSRRWYLKGGEPTELYYINQKIGAVVNILLGIAIIFASIGMSVTEIRGYVVRIDGEELKIPCTYADMEALGYEIDPAEEIGVLHATSKNNKNGASYTVTNSEGKEITIRFENRGGGDKPATECEIIAITVKRETGPQIYLPNNIKLGMSKEDVESVMGRGTVKGIGGSATEYRESVNFNSYKINIVYDGDFMSKKASSIRVEDVIY